MNAIYMLHYIQGFKKKTIVKLCIRFGVVIVQPMIQIDIGCDRSRKKKDKTTYKL